MAKKTLVIVESPAKSQTISKYLGDDFVISSSMGHVRDLPAAVLGIDLKNNYKPCYEELPGKAQVIKELRKLARSADKIYLASDPDREGEAIAFHLQQILQKDNKHIYRVLFNEITRPSILAAVEKPLAIDGNKVDSQQMRRLLDRLAGYKISPVLQRKIGGPLSAGRVQSIALKLIVEREKEIRAFVSEEFWTIAVDLLGSRQPQFTSKLEKFKGKNIKIPDKSQLRPGAGRIEAERICPGAGAEKAEETQGAAAPDHLHPAAGRFSQVQISGEKNHAAGPAAL